MSIQNFMHLRTGWLDAQTKFSFVIAIRECFVSHLMEWHFVSALNFGFAIAAGVVIATVAVRSISIEPQSSCVHSLSMHSHKNNYIVLRRIRLGNSIFDNLPLLAGAEFAMEMRCATFVSSKFTIHLATNRWGIGGISETPLRVDRLHLINSNIKCKHTWTHENVRPPTIWYRTPLYAHIIRRRS